MSATLMATGDGSSRREAVLRGASLLESGELVVFPTETVYGLGAAVSADEVGLRRLREVKRRPADKPFTVHLPDVEAAGRYVDLSSRPGLRRLMERTMPGPITLVVEVGETEMAGRLEALGFEMDQRRLLYQDGTIGLRCPADGVACELLGAVEAPVVASSANRANEPPPHDASMAAEAVGDDAALVIDGGRTRYARPSTVARVGEDGSLKVLREGVFDERYLRGLMTRTVLFICSGNTCRSPMAAALARDALARRVGVGVGGLEGAGWRVGSAGVFAAEGAGMTPEARAAVERLGVEPGDHRSRPLTAEMVRDAEAVYCMTETHRRAVLELAPEAGAKVMRLDPGGEVNDPIGGAGHVYVEVAERIAELVRARVGELIGDG